MEGNTLMDGEIKQAVLKALRLGADPRELQKYLEELYRLIEAGMHYRPNSEVPEFYQAIKDSDFRP